MRRLFGEPLHPPPVVCGVLHFFIGEQAQTDYGLTQRGTQILCPKNEGLAQK